MSNVVPTVVKVDEQLGRKARIARGHDGSPIGVAVFLTAEELTDLGIDPSSVDVVRIRVYGGDVHFVPVNSSDE